MSHTIDINGELLPILVRRRRGARRMVIRYQPAAHALTLTLPRLASLKQGLRFIEEKRMWIARETAARPKKIRLEAGETLDVLGKRYLLCHAGGRGLASVESERLLVHGEPEFMERRVRDWVIAQARAEITRLAREKALALGKTINKISLRDTVSHWGSCNCKGNLSFSWRLAFAPYDVLDYVVAHEVAHLKELNHSKKFWEIVSQLCPHWQASRRWLKQEGGDLYRYLAGAADASCRAASAALV